MRKKRACVFRNALQEVSIEHQASLRLLGEIDRISIPAPGERRVNHRTGAVGTIFGAAMLEPEVP